MTSYRALHDDGTLAKKKGYSALFGPPWGEYEVCFVTFQGGEPAPWTTLLAELGTDVKAWGKRAKIRGRPKDSWHHFLSTLAEVDAAELARIPLALLDDGLWHEMKGVLLLDESGAVFLASPEEVREVAPSVDALLASLQKAPATAPVE